MDEYLSVKEAAVAWGVSERRVHRLCKDGRIVGAVRLGRAWGIPASATKPADGRIRREAARGEAADGQGGREATRGDGDHTEVGTIDNLLGPDATLSVRYTDFAVYQLENDTGNGLVTVYDVFPGVILFYSDLHLQKMTGHDDARTPDGTDMLIINHCREGRFECEFKDGECAYLGEGDLVVSDMPIMMESSSLPLSHYHGITIMLDLQSASETVLGICSLLRIVPIDIRAIKERLLAERAYHLVRGTETIAHIFTEFYSAPPALKESYIRLKLIELLMFLSSAEPKDQERRHYFYKTRVEIVRAIRDHLTANLDKRFTLPELSRLFDIPLTAMKDCFKTVYGSPIGGYMREYRLQAAAVLLRETDGPISGIAARVGYDSHTRFTAAFRAYAGVAPSEYRKVFVRKE